MHEHLASHLPMSGSMKEGESLVWVFATHHKTGTLFAKALSVYLGLLCLLTTPAGAAATAAAYERGY